MHKSSTYYHTLPNGIRIVHRLTESPVSYLGLMIGTGTRDEVPEQNGMAHYIEHTVFKGTKQRTARQIINRIENVGGEINAYTTKEETTFYTATLSHYFARSLELIADLVLHPTFPKKETDKERTVIYDEILSYNDSPSELIYDDFENLLFQNHPLQMPILGTRKTLRYITAEKAQRFMQENYNSDQMVFFSISNLPFQKVLYYAEKYLSDTPYHARTFQREAPSVFTPQTATFHKHTHQTHVMLGTRAFPIGHPKQLALYFLNNIIGGSGMNARLNLALREQRGLVYTIESNYVPLSDTGYWSTYFASESQDTDLCLELIYKQLRELREKPMPQGTLQRYLKQLKGQMAISAENQENNALSMAKMTLYQNQSPDWEDTYQQIATLTPHDLFALANEVFQPQQFSTLLYT